MAGTLQDRSISVPSIVSHYTDEQLNSEYHSKVDYEESINRYGAIYKLIDFNDLKTKEEIKQAAIDWIKDHYFDGVLAFTVKAVDLHLLGFDKDKIRVGDRVSVEFIDYYDQPVTKTLTCLSEQIDILNPQNSSYKIGIPDTSLSLKRRWPGSGKGGGGSSSSGKSSSGGGGSSTMYKYYTEQLKDNRATAQIQADDIYFISQQISSVVGSTKELSWSVDNIQGSAIIQNGTEIVDVVGNFSIKSNYYGDWPEWDSFIHTTGTNYKRGDKVTANGKGYVCIKDCPLGQRISVSNTEYWREDTGRKCVELLDGAAFELSDMDGAMVSVGRRITDLTSKTAEFEGSAIWTQRDNITGVVGEYEIQTDPQTGAKTLIVKSGGGMKIRRDNVEYGIYDENNLTGGIVIKRINDTAFAPWSSDASYPVGAKVKVNGTYYICKEGHNAESTFDPSKWDVYPSAETKITGASVEIEASDWAQWGVYTGDTLTGGIIAQKVNSAADAKINFSQLNTNVTDYTAMGLFDNGTLTGGVLVQKLNDGSTTTKISGDKIDITAQQVRVGSTSNVDAWMSTTDTTLTTHYGLITDRATIYQLNTQTARIDNLEATAITADTLSSEIASLRSVNVQSITSNRGGASFYSLNVSSVPTFGGVDCNVPRAINGITLTPNADNTYTLTASDFAGNTIDIGTFERGAGGPPSSYQLNYLSAPYTYHVRVQIGEGSSAEWYESGDLNATNAYDNGWSGAYDTVEAYRVYDGTPGSTVALGYGDNALIAARAKATSGAQSKTAVEIIKVTSPADRYADGQTAAGLTYDASAHTVSRALTSTAKSYTINMSESGWVSGKNTVSAKIGTTAINSKEVGLPTVTNTSWVNTTGRTWRADVTLGGGTVSSGTKDFGGYYTDGQTDAGLAIGTGNKVVRALSSTTKEYAITATAGISYDSSTHKYTASAQSKAGSTNMGSASTTGGTEAYEAGQTDAGLSIGTGNKVVRALSSATKELAITATASISYNSSTHKYTASAQSKAGSTNMGSASTTGGTEAFEAGVTAGTGSVTLTVGGWSNGSNIVTASNGQTATVATPTISSCTLNGVSSGTTYNINVSMGGTVRSSTVNCSAAYNAGWNACIDACTAHTNAHWGMTYTSNTLYTNTDGSSFRTWSSNGGYKGGSSGTLYEIPAKK